MSKKLSMSLSEAGDLLEVSRQTLESSHKVHGVQAMIEAVGATVLYLPPYSPDLNPIEQMWSKVKAYLRAVKARTVESLLSAIPEAFSSVSVSDIMGWFDCAGYSR